MTRPPMCWRCVRHEVPDQMALCDGCRAWLLEDSDIDPVTAVSAFPVAVEVDRVAAELVAAIGAAINALAPIVQSVIDAFQAFGPELLDPPPTDPVEAVRERRERQVAARRRGLPHHDKQRAPRSIR